MFTPSVVHSSRSTKGHATATPASARRTQPLAAQRDAALLAVDCRDEDVPFVMKTMSDLDREDESNLYLLSLHDFRSAATYVDGVVHSVNAEMSDIAEALATEGLAGLLRCQLA